MNPKNKLEQKITAAILEFENEINLHNSDMTIKVNHEFAISDIGKKSPIRKNIDIEIKL